MALTQRQFYIALLLPVTAVFLWSGINPHDYYTWILEVFPAVIALALLLATHSRFRFTRLVYALIAVHAVILMIGGHYTYALVPAGQWLRDAFDLSRNHYDRLGHFAQGFIPALVAREILVRTSPLKPGKWLFFLVVCVCLAISAVYEFVEWWVAVLSGTAADAFLGTQGDVWDTQKDMLFCTIGAIIALLTLSRAHDRAMRSMGVAPE